MRKDEKRDKAKIRVGTSIKSLEILMRRSGRENQKYDEGSGWLVLFSTHSFRPHTFSILVVIACLIHGVQLVNSC